MEKLFEELFGPVPAPPAQWTNQEVGALSAQEWKQILGILQEQAGPWFVASLTAELQRREILAGGAGPEAEEFFPTVGAWLRAHPEALDDPGLVVAQLRAVGEHDDEWTRQATWGLLWDLAGWGGAAALASPQQVTAIVTELAKQNPRAARGVLDDILSSTPGVITPDQIEAIVIAWGKAGGKVAELVSKQGQQYWGLTSLSRILHDVARTDDLQVSRWAHNQPADQVAAVLHAWNDPQTAASVVFGLHPDSDIPVLNALLALGPQVFQIVGKMAYPDGIVAEWIKTLEPTQLVTVLRGVDTQIAKGAVSWLSPDNRALVLNAVLAGDQDWGAAFLHAIANWDYNTRDAVVRWAGEHDPAQVAAVLHTWNDRATVEEILTDPAIRDSAPAVREALTEIARWEPNLTVVHEDASPEQIRDIDPLHAYDTLKDPDDDT